MENIRKIGNDTDIDRILNREFVSPIRSGYVEVDQDNVCLPVYYEKFEEKIRKFEVYEDDVFITGHPKTGTTWTQEMIWLIVNNLDYAGAAKEHIASRSTQLELNVLFDYDIFSKLLKPEDVSQGIFVNLDYLANPFPFIVASKRPRCIKSHLHWYLFPEQIQNDTKKPKIITVLRNAADACVSLYYHIQTIESYKGTFEDFCELFLAGRVCFGPFWSNVFSYWEQRHRPNILIITYSEMKKDLSGVIRKVSQFLGKSLTEDQVAKLAHHLSFESMKNNPATNNKKFETKNLQDLGVASTKNEFIRSGKEGGYKTKMSPELAARFEAWAEENLAGTGLSLE